MPYKTFPFSATIFLVRLSELNSPLYLDGHLDWYSSATIISSNSTAANGYIRTLTDPTRALSHPPTNKRSFAAHRFSSEVTTFRAISIEYKTSCKKKEI